MAAANCIRNRSSVFGLPASSLSSQGVAVQLGLVCTVMCPGRGWRNLGYAAYAVCGWSANLHRYATCDLHCASSSRTSASCASFQPDRDVRHRACVIVPPVLLCHASSYSQPLTFFFCQQRRLADGMLGGGHVLPKGHVIWHASSPLSLALRLRGFGS